MIEEKNWANWLSIKTNKFLLQTIRCKNECTCVTYSYNNIDSNGLYFLLRLFVIFLNQLMKWRLSPLMVTFKCLKVFFFNKMFYRMFQRTTLSMLRHARVFSWDGLGGTIILLFSRLLWLPKGTAYLCFIVKPDSSTTWSAIIQIKELLHNSVTVWKIKLIKRIVF